MKKKNIYSFLICLQLGLIFTAASFNAQGGVLSKLVRMYHHTSPFSNKYVFQFKGTPIFNTLPENENNKEDLPQSFKSFRFFVPFSDIEKKVYKRKIEPLNKQECYPDYCIKVKKASKPIDGIEYLVMFNAKKRMLDYKSFTSVTGQKGLAFIFYDKGKLEQVSNNTGNTIRRVAFLDSVKPMVAIDYGHGGNDPGFCPKEGLPEKEINYQVGNMLVDELKKKDILYV